MDHGVTTSKRRVSDVDAWSQPAIPAPSWPSDHVLFALNHGLTQSQDIIHL